MKNLYAKITILFLLTNYSLFAQQLPNNQFEDWSGEQFDGNIQPASWNYCNVTQTVAGINARFNFAHRETGRNGGYCMMVQDQDLKVLSFGETSPGYITLGRPWVYLDGVNVKQATAGTIGGIAWGYRPDTMAVWIKRTGTNAMQEDFHLLYYAWSGTAYSNSYKGKDGSCSSTEKTDEESDIRQSTDGNECGTVTTANQIAEGWYRARAVYNDWVQIKVPIYYFNDDVPEKMNVIFSASNYPNFRANSGLFAGNSLFIDDVQLIYSSKIQQLYINGTEWKQFNPNTSATQYYVVDDEITSIPSIRAYRGMGQLTNTKNITTKLLGRQLQGKEIAIVPGEIDQTPTTITVYAEDGSSTTVYSILFMHKASNNANLNDIQMDGQSIKNFNPNISDYTIEVPYGGVAPVVSVTTQEEGQSVDFTQPVSLSDVTIITVTAPDHTTTKTYTLHYQEAPLSDNTLKGIVVNGVALADFLPTKSNYVINLPLGCTKIPTITTLSNYPDGLQTIQMTPPNAVTEGAVYKIQVTTPGNAIPMVYQLAFHLVQSTNCQLQAIYVNGEAIKNFSPTINRYQITLSKGTTTYPQITYTQGDAYQTVEVHTNPITSTTRLTVTAISGNKMTYTLAFINAPTPKNILQSIRIAEIDSTIDLRSADQTTFSIPLPYGTTSCSVSYVKNYDEQTVLVQNGGTKHPTTLTVYPNTANGQAITYTLIPVVATFNPSNLLGIMVDGATVAGFRSNRFSYIVNRTQTTNPTIAVESAEGATWTHTTDLWQSTITIGNGNDTSIYHLYFHYPNEAIPNGEFNMWTKTAKTSSYKPTGWNATNDYVGDYNAEDYVSKSTESIVQLYNRPHTTLDWLTSNYMAAPAIINLASMSAKQTVAGGSRTNVSGTVSFHNTPDQTSFNYKLIDLDKDKAGALFQFKFEDAEGQLSTINHVQSTTQSNFTTQTLSLNLDGKHIRAFDVIVDASSATLHSGKGAHGAKMQVDYIRFAYNNTLTSVWVNGRQATQNGNDFSMVLTSSLDIEEPQLSFVGEVSDQAQDVVWQEPIVEGAFSVRKATITNYGEDGQASTYQLAIHRPLDTNTALQAITIGGKPLSNFHPDQLSYTYCMPYDSEAIPDVVPQLQNKLQTCSVNLANSIVTIQVKSENGNTRTYTIQFTFLPTLAMVTYNKTKVPNFEENQFNYTIQLQQDETLWPAIAYTKKDSNQMVDVFYNDSLATASIQVTSPDRTLRNTYTLTFLPYLSQNARLKDLQVSNYSLNFHDNIFIYSGIELESLQLPSIAYTLAEPTQTIEMDTIYQYNMDSTFCKISVTLTITAEDLLTKETYVLQFTYSNPNTYLKNIWIKQQKLDTTLGFTTNFHSEQLDYHLSYPIGTDPDVLFTNSDFAADAYNANAMVRISTTTTQYATDTTGRSVPVQTCTYIIVQVDNHNRTYTIRQTLQLDSLNRTTQLLVANQQGILTPVAKFTPDELYYEYLLTDTRNTVPDFTLEYSNTNSRFAHIGFERGNDFRIVDAADLTNYATDNSENDPCYRIYYQAENGTRYSYKIKFCRTAIKRAQTPTEGDVLIQPIPGSNQIAVASLRANVTFGLYNMSGKMLKLVNLPENDPNSVETTTDGFGQTYFSHLSDYSSCTIIDLEPNKLYMWVFLDNGKRNIKSGKITLVR